MSEGKVLTQDELKTYFQKVSTSEKLKKLKIGSKHSAGIDLPADLPNEEPIVIPPWGNVIIKTGYAMSIPENHAGFIKGRSGLGFRKNITAFEGTLDSDYQGEICVKLFNLDNQEKIIKFNDYIAQLVIVKYANYPLVEVDSLTETEGVTERGTGGFGSTGN